MFEFNYSEYSRDEYNIEFTQKISFLYLFIHLKVLRKLIWKIIFYYLAVPISTKTQEELKVNYDANMFVFSKQITNN